MINRKKCCGCQACVQKCPKSCISMEEDDEGFLYPKIDKEKCIDCHLCEKVCPVLEFSLPNLPIVCYAAKNPNDQIRRVSSSGGIFTMLAERIIAKGGVVFGAAFNDKWEVVHTYTESKEGLQALRGSKYVQSRIGNTYRQAEDFLKDGRLVLFSGTPCQIAGLRNFLGNKEYANLLNVDFVCHGVPSPGVFRWYLQEELNNYAARQSSKKTDLFPSVLSIPKADVLVPEGLNIEGISFRDKRKGWKKYSFVLLLAEVSAEGQKNKVSLSYTLNECKYLDGFFNDLYLRPCCYECRFKGLRSGADITIGDFWNLDTYNRQFDDDQGVSCVICLSEKGEKLIKNLDCKQMEVPYSAIALRNQAINHSATLDLEKRTAFYTSQDLIFSALVSKLCKLSLKKRTYLRVYRMLQKIGLMRIIQAIKYNKL